jgi:hypothetical protein
MLRITIEFDGGNVTIGGFKPQAIEMELPHQSKKRLEPAKRVAPLDKLQRPMPEAKVKSCDKCGKIFTPQGPRQKYCSEACGFKPKPESERLRAHLKSKRVQEKFNNISEGTEPIKIDKPLPPQGNYAGKTPEQISKELEETLREIEEKRKQPISLT